jgi:hypothetical protein
MNLKIIITNEQIKLWNFTSRDKILDLTFSFLNLFKKKPIGNFWNFNKPEDKLGKCRKIFFNSSWFHPRLSQIYTRSIPDQYQINTRSVPDQYQISTRSIPDQYQINARSTRSSTGLINSSRRLPPQQPPS